jgi:hypothetical protein
VAQDVHVVSTPKQQEMSMDAYAVDTGPGLLDWLAELLSPGRESEAEAG